MPITREFQRARFTIDSLPNRIFEGFTDGDTWNGWACPYFSRDVAESILQASENNGYSWTYDAKTGSFIVHHHDDPKDSEPELFNGVWINIDNESILVYAIGAYAWAWDIQV